jgi:hypothetical protein
MVQKTNKKPIHRKRVIKENDLTQKIVSRILMLHELGIPAEAIRLDIYETCHAKVSICLINRITVKTDCLVEEWLNRMKRSIGAENYVP